MHLFLTGSVQIGKTTALNKTLELLKVTPGGFRSYFGADRKSPCRYLYMSSAAEPCTFTPEHAIVKYGLNENGMPVHIVLPRFEELGLQYLSEASSYPLIVLDECGRFAVPLLSGHLGGANALAWALAEACGAIPVITTATDANGVFAVDEWAKAQGCAVLEPERIKLVSGALLAGHTVRLASDWPVQGAPPAGVALAGAGEAADFALTLTPGKTAPEALHLVPRIGVLGVGCKRGTTADQLEAAFAAFCAAHGLAPAGIRGAASIDLKQDEPGLAAFCAAHGWPITFYTARQLQAVEGHFTPSAFVRSVTGVDNVCERAAVCAADGPLQVPKQAGGGVTLALAAKPFAPDWSWKDAEP